MNTDTQILTALRRAAPGGVSGAELSQRLQITRAAVWARIEALRTLGYEIEASPHQGYRLRAVPDVLHAEDLLSCLALDQPPSVVGRDIRVFQETHSTMDIAEKLARDGVGEGVVVFAEKQTHGRGRLGRTWDSPAGKGLWCSVLLRPDLPPPAATRLTVAAATAIVRAIADTCGINPQIKWPNDILLRGRKVAGVLTELSAELDHIRHLVIGIGVDVNQESADLPPDLRSVACSIRMATGKPTRRADLAVALVRELDRDYHRVSDSEFPGLAEEWRQSCSTLGQHVVIRIGDRRVTGRAESLDEDGALLVRSDHGRLERITGGDVALEKAAVAP